MGTYGMLGVEARSRIVKIEVRRVPVDRLAEDGSGHWVELAQKAIGSRGRFCVAVAGGNTPRDMYARLAGSRQTKQVDWGKVYVFWGDERCVPPDHPDSNYRMARDAWLAHVPLPDENVFRLAGELEPRLAATQYEATLRAFFGPAGVPRFDLVLLGLGADGHTASLFPGTDAVREADRWVIATYVDHLNAWRLTLTPGVINAARHVTFLVAGDAKAQVLRDILTGPHEPDRLPAQIVRPESGKVLWLVDQAAASLLP